MNKKIWFLLVDNIVSLKCYYTERVINFTVCGVCFHTGTISFLAAF